MHDPKVGSLISYEGTTTADGAGDGSSLIDSVLTTKPDYDGNLCVITSGAYFGQARDIDGTTTGTVNPTTAFGGQILRGTTFVIVALRLTPAEVAAIEAKLDHASHGLAALKALIDAIKAVTDVIPDAGALTALLTSIASILEDTETTLPAILATIAGYIDNEVAAIEAKLDSPAHGLAALQTLLAAITAAGPTNAQLNTAIALITAVTDNLPDAGVLSSLAQDATVAKEAT
ncbi:unnamed protein product, partial [marine sediment metagenome]